MGWLSGNVFYRQVPLPRKGRNHSNSSFDLSRRKCAQLIFPANPQELAPKPCRLFPKLKSPFKGPASHSIISLMFTELSKCHSERSFESDQRQVNHSEEFGSLGSICEREAFEAENSRRSDLGIHRLTWFSTQLPTPLPRWIIYLSVPQFPPPPPHSGCFGK